MSHLLVIDLEDRFLASPWTRELPARISGFLDSQSCFFEQITPLCQGRADGLCPGLASRIISPARRRLKPGSLEWLGSRDEEGFVLTGAGTSSGVLALALGLQGLGAEVRVIGDLCADQAGGSAHRAALEILARNLGSSSVITVSDFWESDGAPPASASRLAG